MVSVQADCGTVYDSGADREESRGTQTPGSNR